MRRQELSGMRTKYYVRARRKTGPDLIYEISSHRTEEEAQQAADEAVQSGKWDSAHVTTVPLPPVDAKTRRRPSGRRYSRH